MSLKVVSVEQLYSDDRISRLKAHWPGRTKGCVSNQGKMDPIRQAESGPDPYVPEGLTKQKKSTLKELTKEEKLTLETTYIQMNPKSTFF